MQNNKKNKQVKWLYDSATVDSGVNILHSILIASPPAGILLQSIMVERIIKHTHA